ncbi:MAG: phosphoribosylamine--glycine ligase, partial [Planctomycetes bacterium]|nr:phosphoribosylamine--glycine ligase [Planctomycetota bacterium]
GDPETQVILPRLQSDLVDLLEAVVDGRLADVEVRWKPRAAVCVVMASAGYPGSYQSGKVIKGLAEVDAMTDVHVFHAGTKRLEHLTVSSGGRVLGVTGLGEDVAAAQQRAYAAVERIHFENAYYRRDIGYRAVSAASTT